MTNAIRFRAKIESDTLRIPELLSLLGKVVEVIILEDEPAPPLPAAKPKRTLGALRGQAIVPDDFDAPLPEDVLRSFEANMLLRCCGPTADDQPLQHPTTGITAGTTYG